jgi:hypothetical protein
MRITMTHRPTYDATMKERAFVVWLFEADRDPGRTEQILAEDAATMATDGATTLEDTPDKRTILRWSSEDDWHKRAQETLSRHSEAGKQRQEGRLRLIQDRAISEHDAILRGERDHLPAAALHARVTLIKIGYEATGMGSYGVKHPAPAVPPPYEAALDAQSDPLALAESFRRRSERLGIEG